MKKQFGELLESYGPIGAEALRQLSIDTMSTETSVDVNRSQKLLDNGLTGSNPVADARKAGSGKIKSMTVNGNRESEHQLH